MSASSRTSASFTVAGEDKRVRCPLHAIRAQATRFTFARSGPAARELTRYESAPTTDTTTYTPTPIAGRPRARSSEEVGARVGGPVDQGDRSKREWEFDPALAVPEALAPVCARDGHAHLDGQ